MLVLDWSPFRPHSWFNSLWRFRKVMETFLRYLWSILTWMLHTTAAYLSIPHPWCKSHVPLHSKGALLGWELVTLETRVQETHCHFKGTAYFLFFGLLSVNHTDVCAGIFKQIRSFWNTQTSQCGTNTQHTISQHFWHPVLPFYFLITWKN